MTLDVARWGERLRELAEAHGVPGASLAVHAGGETTALACGYVNAATRVEATVDAAFPIASISKCWTATAVMRLVERGALELDRSVTDALPELELPVRGGDPPVTLRHLLSHTSGLDMDNFADTGCGDDALARYVATCSRLQRLTAPGVVFSYGNAGFSIAGRLIERSTGLTWDEAMRELLLEPLALEHTFTLPREAPLHRAAVGHVAARPAAGWPMTRAAGPAGGMFASASDLVRFARMHLDGGVAENGTRLLAEQSVAALRERVTLLPDPRIAAGWSLAWTLLDWDGLQVVGHDGGAAGIATWLRMLPSAGTAVALLTNGGEGEPFAHALLSELFSELHGIAPAPAEAPPAPPPALQLERYAGSYRRPAWKLDVTVEEGALHGRLHVEEPVSTELGTDVLELEFAALDEVRFVQRARGSGGSWAPAAFFEVPGYGRFVHMWSRTTPLVDAPA